jgi:hypothetical protein
MTIRIDSLPFDVLPAGRVVIHHFARRATLDALAPADRLLDVACGGGLLLRDNSDDHGGLPAPRSGGRPLIRVPKKPQRLLRRLGRLHRRLTALRAGARALGQDDKLHTNQREGDEDAPLVRVKTSAIAVRH